MPPIREMLAEYDITEQQWRVLRVLAEYGAQDTTTVAHRSCLLVSSLTRIAKKMHDKELITVSRDGKDRRRQTITITEAGQHIVDCNQETAAGIVKSFKKTLGAENYEQLLDLLALLEPDDSH